jgi:DNA-binding transcriptional LysR family regulator
MERPLDLDAVQAFVLVADMQSFTRAAEALDSTQSAISLKLKKLEQRLARRLLERTPRLCGCRPTASTSCRPRASCWPRMSGRWAS